MTKYQEQALGALFAMACPALPQQANAATAKKALYGTLPGGTKIEAVTRTGEIVGKHGHVYRMIYRALVNSK